MREIFYNFGAKYITLSTYEELGKAYFQLYQ